MIPICFCKNECSHDSLFMYRRVLYDADLIPSQQCLRSGNVRSKIPLVTDSVEPHRKRSLILKSRIN